MIKADDLRLQVVRPVLNAVDLWSRRAEDLLLGTAATESHMGTYLVQVGGPALGIYQCEPATHDDIWANYLSYRLPLAAKVREWSLTDGPGEMVWNLAYATIMARLVYLRSPKPLPPEGDVIGMARMWKTVFNTVNGKGKEEDFISAYRLRVQRRG